MHSFRRAALRVLSKPSPSSSSFSSSSSYVTAAIARSGSRPGSLSLGTAAGIRPLRLGSAHSVAIQRRWNTSNTSVGKQPANKTPATEDQGDEQILESAVKSTVETGSTVEPGTEETPSNHSGEQGINTQAEGTADESSLDGLKVSETATPSSSSTSQADGLMDQILDAHESSEQLPGRLRVAETPAAGESSSGVVLRHVRHRQPQQQEGDPVDPEEAIQQRRASFGRSEPAPKETLFLGNLFFDVTANDIRRFAEGFGVVEHATVVHNDRGKSLGFGYVTFDSVETAKRAKEQMHLKIFEGRRLVVNFAQANSSTRKTMPATRTLFIGNLAHEMTDRDLQDLFKDVANVIDVRVSVDKRTGQPRGFVHAEFIDIESAQLAREILSRKAPYGRKLRLDFAHSNKRAGRRANTNDAGEGPSPAQGGEY